METMKYRFKIYLIIYSPIYGNGFFNTVSKTWADVAAGLEKLCWSLLFRWPGTNFPSQNKKIPLKANTIIMEQTMSNPSAPNVHWQQNENHCCSLGVSRFRRPPEPAVPLKLSQNVTLSHQRINSVKSLPLAAIFISEAVKFALCHVMPMLWQQHSKDSNSSSHKHRSVTLYIQDSATLIV